STRSAKNLRASCVVDDGGTADCILRVRGCWASAVPASNMAGTAATRAALVSELIFICVYLPFADCRRAIWIPPANNPTASGCPQPERRSHVYLQLSRFPEVFC